MIVFVNGQFVPEEQAVVSIFDRCFRYGDGLFETALIANGKLFRWAQHFERLQHSAAFLKIPVPFSADALRDAALELSALNQLPNAVLRLTLSRGAGPRHYAPTGTETPFLALSLHEVPPCDERPWKLATASVRVAAGDPLARHKTCSRLLNVLAATEARDCGADEALLLDTDGRVLEGTMSNVFWIAGGTVCTTPLTAGVLPGVTRAVVREVCAVLNLPWSEQLTTPQELARADGAFLSVTTRGLVELDALDGHALARSPLVARLQECYRQCVARECA